MERERTDNKGAYRFLHGAELALYAVMMLATAAVALTSVVHPGDTLLMLTASLAGTAVFFLAVHFLAGRLRPLPGRALFVLLILYGILLYAAALSYGNRWEGVMQADYSEVYLGASELARGEALSQEGYFLYYSNNIKPMILLSVLMRVSNALGFPDPYYILLLLSCLLVAGSLYAAWVLAGEQRFRLMLLLQFVLCLPVWLMTDMFYTDALSFGTGLMAVALLHGAGNLRGEDAGRRVRSVLRLAAGALLLGIGMTVKITALFPLIAYVLTLLFAAGKGRAPFRPYKMLLFAALLVITLLVTNARMAGYDISRKAAASANPAISWIALGLHGDGSWTAGYDFIHEINAMETTEEKRAASAEYIRTHAADFFDPVHLFQKMQTNFNSGTLGVKSFLREDPETREHPFYRMFANGGSLYWPVTGFCMIYIFSVYLSLFLGMLACFVRLLRGMRVPFVTECCHVCFFGLFVFLMLWEANNRQLYNQIPVLTLGALLSADCFLKTFFAGKEQA